jgi:uncharacterized protein
VFAVVVFVCFQAQQEPQLTKHPGLGHSEEAPAPVLGANWAADFPQRIDLVTAALSQLPVLLPRPAEEPQGSGKVRWRLRRYEVNIPAPDQPGVIEALVAPVRNAAPGVTVGVNEHQTGAQVRIGIDGLLTHAIEFQWLGRRPRAAIIVDGLGDNLLTAREMAQIEAPLTFAVLPFQPFSAEVAELARMFGRQVLVHMPINDDGQVEGTVPGALRRTATRDEVVAVLDQSLAAVPKAVGVNNQSGSGFTADRERTRWLLERIKEDALFFIDSQTSASSVACEVAAEISLPCSTRSLLIDSSSDEPAVAAQLAELTHVARTRGDAIAIVHAGPGTAAAIRAAVPDLAAAGVDVVPASMIVLDESLSKR